MTEGYLLLIPAKEQKKPIALGRISHERITYFTKYAAVAAVFFLLFVYGINDIGQNNQKGIAYKDIIDSPELNIASTYNGYELESGINNNSNKKNIISSNDIFSNNAFIIKAPVEEKQALRKIRNRSNVAQLSSNKNKPASIASYDNTDARKTLESIK